MLTNSPTISDIYERDVHLDFRNTGKDWEKNLVSYATEFELVANFFILGTEYMSSTANVLTNSPKISDITEEDIFQLIFWESDEKIW